MGYADCNIIMEPRTGSASSGTGYSLDIRGKTLESSPFCPRSSSKLTQSIIRDHMVSHYKKVYSAKAAIDVSVPKSLIYSVKYNDQLRQERLRKGGRPQSAHSLSQMHSRASCSSVQSSSSVQYDDIPYHCSRSSVVSSPRFNTSFHAKEIVYPPCEVRSQDYSRPPRPASEIKYRMPEAASRRKQSACSLATSGDQSCFKTFKDPVQKTYSGDLLQKHSQHFTQDKPFTPKTLKSDKSSSLSKYRYYRAPRRNPTQDCTNSRWKQQETYLLQSPTSTKTKQHRHKLFEPTQEFSTEHEWSDDDFNGTYFSASRQQTQAQKSRDCDLFDSLSRVSFEGGKSPIMRSISSEEEELMYLEFISAVTEDILSRGSISNRVLDRVMKRHIDMNRHQLNEDKMRHLLDVLRKDFEEPNNTYFSSAELRKKDLLDTLQPQLKSGLSKQTKEDLSPYVSLSKYRDSPDYADPLMVSTPLCSPESAPSQVKRNENTEEGDNQEHDSDKEDVHPIHMDEVVNNKDVINQSHEYSTTSEEEGFNRGQAQVSYDSYEGQSKELEDLGRSLSESLHVSSNNHCDDPGTANEQHTDTITSVSDDEF